MKKLFVFGLVMLVTSLQLGFAVEGDVDQITDTEFRMPVIETLNHDPYEPVPRGTTEVIIGTPAAGNYIPWWGQSHDAFRFQVLFLQSEINIAGDIINFAFQPYYDDIGTFDNVRIYFCHTSVTQLGTVFDDNYTGNTPVEVMNEASMQVGGPANQWLEWDINFSYNNTDNVLIEIKWNGDNGTGVPMWRTAESIPRRLYAFNDNASSGSTQNTGNYMKFIIDDLGVEEEIIIPAKEYRLGSTIISGPLHLPEGKEYKILDITGRQVSADNMQPGVYFIEIDDNITEKIIKVR